jgi:hypothetical protein
MSARAFSYFLPIGGIGSRLGLGDGEPIRGREPDHVEDAISAKADDGENGEACEHVALAHAEETDRHSRGGADQVHRNVNAREDLPARGVDSHALAERSDHAQCQRHHPAAEARKGDPKHEHDPGSCQIASWHAVPLTLNARSAG